ncbi:MAG: hypothetical protein JNK29_05345, partial [Anaerolineales bacterium]|nr:hypothetical protein [Anaerolineales bacterium]
MSTRLRLGLLSLVALGALLWGAGRAAAGGWAIATLEALPQDLVAGQPASFRFAVRQHGITLVDWVAPTLRFEHTVSGQVVNAVAQPAGTVGYFEAEVILPEAGVWEWTVDPFGGSLIQPMPPLSVAEAGPAAAASRLEAPRP